MDHIVLPRKPARLLPSVKVYTKVEYDGGPFLEYLDRIAWTEEQLVNWFSPKTSDEIHAVLQTWTYFGFLSTVLGHPVPMARLTRQQHDGETILDTTELPALVQAWVEREWALPKPKRLADEEHMRLCLDKIWRLYGALGKNRTSPHNQLDSYFCLSVLVLYELLISLQKYAFHPPHLEMPSFDDIKNLLRDIPFSRDGLYSNMHAAGWCKTETYSMNKLLPSELCLVYCLDRPGPDKDHAKCSNSKCLAYQVSEVEYKTRHTAEDCYCEHVYCSQTELAKILLDGSGSIPLISHAEPTRDRAGKLWVTLLPSKGVESDEQKTRAGASTRHSKFVAISHVWSDGLGNNRDNAIPLCQFRRLCKLVSGLYAAASDASVPFWFDTLCFPLAPQEAGDKALVRMRESYEDADQVLVLDGYLLSSVDPASMSDNELLLRIFCAPWSRRLWTLQEAVLPRTLCFRLGNTYVPSRQLTGKIAERTQLFLQGRQLSRSELALEPLPTTSYMYLVNIRELDDAGLHVLFSPVVVRESLRMFPHHIVRLLLLDRQHYLRLAVFLWHSFVTILLALRNFNRPRSRSTTAPMTIDGVQNAITHRATSMARDEPLCLGNLLGVDPAAVVAARTPEARMEIIWDTVFSQGRGHGAVVFSGAPKLRTPGYRWAPSSLMDGDPLEFWGGLSSFIKDAQKVPLGLIISAPAVSIQAWKLALGPKFHMRTSPQNGYVVSLTTNQRMAGLEEDEVVHSVTGAFSILTMAPLEEEGTPSFVNGLQGVTSLLAVVGAREGGLTRLRLLAGVSVERLSDNSAISWTPEELEKCTTYDNPLVGRVLPKGKWLLE